MRFIDLTGRRFGRWLVRKRVGSTGSVWECQCDCGTVTSVLGGNLRHGLTTSCGCFRQETAAYHTTKHGYAKAGSVTPEWRAWAEMRRRCFNQNTKQYEDWGRRGITVCKRWLEGEKGIHPFECFLRDMGSRPSPQHTLERKDNNKWYEPGNCKWATREEQANNRRPKTPKYKSIMDFFARN